MYVGPGPGQGQPPWMMNSLRDNEGSYRAEPAIPYLGRRAASGNGAARVLNAIGFDGMARHPAGVRIPAAPDPGGTSRCPMPS